MKKNNNITNIVMGILIGALGGLIVVLLEIYIFKGKFELSWYDFILFFIFIILSTIIHEFGHFLFGKLTHYKLISFRVFNYVIRRNSNDKLIITKSTRPGGFLGQCLMKPNFEYNDDIPFVLYNLGGGVTNIFTCILCFMLVLTPYKFLWHIGITGLLANMIFAISNLVPAVAPMPNDGYNITLIRKSLKTKEAYYHQLIYADLLAKGYTYNELPEEYFSYNITDIENLLFISFVFWRYYRNLYKGEIIEAGEIITELHKDLNNYPLSYQNLISLEYYYYIILYKGNIQEAYDMYMSFKKNLKNLIDKNKSELMIRIRILRLLVLKKDYSNAVITIKEYRERIKKVEYKAEMQLYEFFVNYMEESHLPLNIERENEKDV